MALAQHGNEDLLDIGKETLGVDQPVEQRAQSAFAGDARKQRLLLRWPFGAWPPRCLRRVCKRW